MRGKMFISYCDDHCGPLLPHALTQLTLLIPPTKQSTQQFIQYHVLLIGSFPFRYPFPMKKKKRNTFFPKVDFFPTNRISDWKVCILYSKLCFVFCCQPRREAANHIDTRSTYSGFLIRLPRPQSILPLVRVSIAVKICS